MTTLEANKNLSFTNNVDVTRHYYTCCTKKSFLQDFIEILNKINDLEFLENLKEFISEHK